MFKKIFSAMLLAAMFFANFSFCSAANFPKMLVLSESIDANSFYTMIYDKISDGIRDYVKYTDLVAVKEVDMQVDSLTGAKQRLTLKTGQIIMKSRSNGGTVAIIQPYFEVDKQNKIFAVSFQINGDNQAKSAVTKSVFKFLVEILGLTDSEFDELLSSIKKNQTSPYTSTGIVWSSKNNRYISFTLDYKYSADLPIMVVASDSKI